MDEISVATYALIGLAVLAFGGWLVWAATHLGGKISEEPKGGGES